MKKATPLTLLIVLLLLSLTMQSCSASGTKAPEATVAPIHVNVGILPYISYAPFYIAQDLGYFKEQGLDVEFVSLDQSETAAVVSALIKGQLDVHSALLDISILNAIAKGARIKFVADKGYNDPNGCDYLVWMAPKALVESGKLNDFKNIVGMKGAFTPVSSMEYFFDQMVKSAGVSSKDVEITDINPPTRMESLKNGSIEFASMSEPWVTRSLSSGSVVWQRIQQLMPNFPVSLLFFGTNFLEKNPDAGKRFMVAYLKAVKTYNEGKTDSNVSIISKYTQFKPEDLKGMCWQTIRPNGSVDASKILDFQNWAISKGYAEIPLTSQQVWDPQYIEYANKVLGGSQP